MNGLILSCHCESDIPAGTVISKLMVTKPARSATFLNLAVTFEALITSVATISPVSESLIAFMIMGPSERVLRILSTSTGLSSSAGLSSGTESPIMTSPERILCILRYGVHDKPASKSIISRIPHLEHIGNRYHQIIRQQKILPSMTYGPTTFLT